MNAYSTHKSAVWMSVVILCLLSATAILADGPAPKPTRNYPPVNRRTPEPPPSPEVKPDPPKRPTDTPVAGPVNTPTQPPTDLVVVDIRRDTAVTVVVFPDLDTAPAQVDWLRHAAQRTNGPRLSSGGSVASTNAPKSVLAPMLI
jgi:hypothetical protein